MKLRILLALMFSVSAAQSQPLAEASSRYVLIGKHSETWSLCYANIVAEKFKDGAYVEAEVAESAKRDQDVQCKPMPHEADVLEKEAQEQCDEAQESAKRAAERFEKRGQVPGVEPLSDAMGRVISACNPVRSPRLAGGQQGCLFAIKNLERSQVLTVTKRLGPYPTEDRAADELRADGWRTGTSPSGNPIWFKKESCKQDP
jgi:hypothetical protein